jgi:membrane-associated phospholipid phosphatase
MRAKRTPQLPVFKDVPAEIVGKPLGDPLMQLKKDFRRTFQATVRFLRRWRWPILASGTVLWVLALVLLNPRDIEIVDLVRSVERQGLERTAGQLGKWGDFSRFNLIFFFSLWTIAFFTRSRLHQRLAVVILLASIFAGMTCNLAKYLTGRPRPHAEVADRFYGVTAAIQGWDFHSFPSGHTSTAFGAASAILAGAGPVGRIAGGVTTAFSGSISWARIYKDRHYPTDVVAGIWLGTVFGLATGMPYRRLRRRLQRRLAARASMPRSGIPTATLRAGSCESPVEPQGSTEAGLPTGVTTRSSTQLDRATL